MAKKTAIIIGAGPAGMTAAYELLTRTDIQPIVLERGEALGGLAQTFLYKGNRLDLGGHRFFSKSQRVLDWWYSHLPIASEEEATRMEDCFLIRRRHSRIYFLQQFFAYPIRPTWETVAKLGAVRTFRIALSYARSRVFPIRPERTLEDFFINRFGGELYQTFFRDYTEKVWGRPCNQVGAEWGAQRIKGLSIGRAIRHFLRKEEADSKAEPLERKTETSLIERFLYPKLGAGQMWEVVGRRIRELGGEILTGWDVRGLEVRDGRVLAVEARNESSQMRRFTPDYVFSTTSIQELIRAFFGGVPANVQEVAEGLEYRDMIVVGVLARSLQKFDSKQSGPTSLLDNWIYIQEPGVRMGRLQIFNNWSPYLAADGNTAWLGAEYFCKEGDELWSRGDNELSQLAAKELADMKLLTPGDLLDSTVVRMRRTYPAYFGTYGRLDEIRDFLDRFDNLYLIGRNGMHRYNNMDHSMLTAMTAVDNLLAGIRSRDNLWALNTEAEYQEADDV